MREACLASIKRETPRICGKVGMYESLLLRYCLSIIWKYYGYTLPCHTCLTFAYELIRCFYGFLSTYKKPTLWINLFLRYYTFKNPAIWLVKTILEFQILPEMGFVMKGQKLQEFSNAKIRNYLFCGPLCQKWEKMNLLPNLGFVRLKILK